MFDPQPAHDFHGLRTLLRQLLGNDSALFDLSSLTDLILSQPLVGTTVKVDSNETDPYAFLTVLNVNQHRESNSALATLADYLLEKSKANSKLHEELTRILSVKGNGGKGKGEGSLGLILTERMINMPVEVVPPMYKMLQEEVQWALDDKEPYNFDSYLVLSKTYTEVPSKLDADDDEEDEGLQKPKSKKFKSRMRQIPRRKEIEEGEGKGKEVFCFHLEDEVLHQSAVAWTDFKYTKEQGPGAADSKRTFSELGIVTQGHMVLFKKEKLGEVVRKLESQFAPS